MAIFRAKTVQKGLIRWAVRATVVTLAAHYGAPDLWGTEPASNPHVKPLEGASAIVGRVEARAECEKGELEAFLSQDSLLLYQVDVSQHGSFEFHVLPGHYNLVVAGSTGCFSENKIDVQADQVKTVTANPVPTAKAEKTSWLDRILPSAYAWMDDCPYCNMMSYYQMQPSFMPQMPWYGYYGSMAYPNFGYPGPWAGMGMNGGMYPGMSMGMGMQGGGGGWGMGKPVLYLEGKDGTQVSVRARLAQGGNWLAMVPAHGETGWSGKLQKNRIVSDGGEFKYFFYDYRTPGDSLQDERGFCTRREQLIPRLKTALKESGFKENEIHDFEQYWSVKIPLSHRYCVYPQTTAELRKLASLEIEPKPASLTQLTFLIQVDEALTGKPGRFTHAPAKTWEPEARAPASDGELRAREWGMGFMFTRGKP